MPTKPRVYGEQIQVRFCDNNNLAALVIDFDSMETRLLTTQEESYKTIGKAVSTHISNFDGYEITLTRNKRDPYLDAIILHLSKMARNRRGYSDFSIYKTIRHTYGSSSIDPEKELPRTLLSDGVVAKDDTGFPFLDSALGALNFLSNPVGAIGSAIGGQVLNVAKDVAVNAAAGALGLPGFDVPSLTNAIASKSPFGSTAVNILNNIMALPNYIKMFTIQPFVEAIVYSDCTVVGFSSSDSPHNASEQSITFKCAYAKSFVEDNSYDKYVKKVIANNYLTRLLKDYDHYKDRIEEIEGTPPTQDLPKDLKVVDVFGFAT